MSFLMQIIKLFVRKILFILLANNVLTNLLLTNAVLERENVFFSLVGYRYRVGKIYSKFVL